MLIKLNKFFEWLSDTRGVTGFEYSFIVAVISLFVMATSMAIGDDIISMFGEEGLGSFINQVIL